MKYQLIQTMTLPNGGSADVEDTAPDGTTETQAIDYLEWRTEAVKERIRTEGNGYGHGTLRLYRVYGASKELLREVAV